MKVLRFMDADCICKEDYIAKYGKHFNEKLLNYAVQKMMKNGRVITPISKEQLDGLLSEFGVSLENNQLWDYVYVANMCKADFYGSSIMDDEHLALYIKDVIDDEDGYEGMVFCRWYADMKNKEEDIAWEDML